MATIPYWFRAPSEVVLNAIPKFEWQPYPNRPAATATAALMVYHTMLGHTQAPKARASQKDKGLLETMLGSLFTATAENTKTLSEQPVFLDGLLIPQTYVCGISYDVLQNATSLSRTLIAAGLTYLEDLGLIKSEGPKQGRKYIMTWSSGGWFKLPYQPIVRDGVYLPFRQFTLRSRHELDALKIYFYLAGRRSNQLQYTLSSYETIYKYTGVSERYIRKALNLLTVSGLMANIKRDRDDDNEYGPNRYYLAGYKTLWHEGDKNTGLKSETSVKPRPPKTESHDIPF